MVRKNRLSYIVNAEKAKAKKAAAADSPEGSEDSMTVTSTATKQRRRQVHHTTLCMHIGAFTYALCDQSKARGGAPSAHTEQTTWLQGGSKYVGSRPPKSAEELLGLSEGSEDDREVSSLP